MRTCAMIALLVAVLGIGAAQAQTCTTPITAWGVHYSISGNGTGTDADGFHWTISESASGITNVVLSTALCTGVWWTGQGTASTVSFNAQGVRPCESGSSVAQETSIFTGSSSVPDYSQISVDLSKNVYSFSPPTAVSVTWTVVACDGSSTTQPLVVPARPAWISPPDFPLPSSPQPLTGNTTNLQGTLLPVPGGIPMNWNFSFTLNPRYTPDDSCQQQGNSSIGCQDQNLGEDVPVVGTGFSLHYASSRATGGGNSVASANAAMLGGWTLSVHHAYDPVSNTLFLGDGSQRNAYQLGSPVSFNGNVLLMSQDGTEIYAFSSSGQHLQTLRPLTGTLLYQFGYDPAGKLVTVADANGNVTTIQRDAVEHPTAIVSPDGTATTLSVDNNGVLSQVTDPLGKSTALTNSATGLLASRTDRNGNIFNYIYDTEGRLERDADSIGGFTALTRTDSSSGFGWTTGETTSMGRTSSYQSTLNVAWVQNGSSTFSRQQMNKWPNGLQASRTALQQGSAISESVTLPDGTSNSDTLGPDPIWGIQSPVVSSETRTLGNLTMNITSSRTASLGTAGNPFSLTTQTDTRNINSRTYVSTFTASNLNLVDATPMGRTRTTVLDSQERIASTELGGLLPSKFVYDSRGRVSAVTRGTRTGTLTYGTGGRLATIVDPAGLQTSFSYDLDGRLLSKTVPDGRIIGYSYDTNGNLTSVTPPGKSAHTFTYTAVNEMTEYNPPSVSGTGPTTYSYNLDRDLAKITRPDGTSIAFGYDSAGHLSAVTTPSETIGYTYDPTSGNLTAANITNGESLSYGYNGPLPTSTGWAGAVNGSVSRVYNNNFWVTSQSINGGNTIAFTYDNDGLLTGAGALSLVRSPQNALITGTTLGGASDSRSYNSFGELTDYRASYSNGPLFGISYTRDADGRITNKTESGGAAYSYSYDPTGRLVGVSKNGGPISSYSYDTNSNRLSATTSSGTVVATYDAQDRLLTYGSATYTYTANGERASQTVAGATTGYTYDTLGNLTGVTPPTGATISYVIDAEGRRVGKKVNAVLVAGYLYEGGQIVAQLDSNNNVVSRFVYGTHVNSPDYMVRNGVAYRILTDQLGSPILIVNATTGEIAEQIDYGAFGNVIQDTNSGFQPFGFAGGLSDPDTGLVHFGARDYDPAIGGWTVKDPSLFSGDDPNLYRYVKSDPINRRDSTGLGDDECACEQWQGLKNRLPLVWEQKRELLQTALEVALIAREYTKGIFEALESHGKEGLDDIAAATAGYYLLVARVGVPPMPSCKLVPSWLTENQFWRQIHELSPMSGPAPNPEQENPGYARQ
jgi:RHS repeat-associated protein